MKYKNYFTQYAFIFCVIFSFLFSVNVAYAQDENSKPEPSLSFFSEDGIRFWISINGEKQNKVASSNVKIPATQDTWLKAKIIFENESLPEISKNVAMSTKGDVVYRIKKARKKYVVRMFSSPNSLGTGFGDDESASTNNTPCYGEMPSGSFYTSLSAVQKETFEATKLSTSKQIADNNCLSTDQIKSLMKAYQYEASRLEFAKYAYKRCYDPQNYHLINDAFEYAGSKSEMADFVKKK